MLLCMVTFYKLYRMRIRCRADLQTIGLLSSVNLSDIRFKFKFKKRQGKPL